MKKPLGTDGAEARPAGRLRLYAQGTEHTRSEATKFREAEEHRAQSSEQKHEPGT